MEQKLIELACSDPPEGRCYWTMQLLADELVVLGCVEAVGRESVRKVLKKTRHCTLGSQNVVYTT